MPEFIDLREPPWLADPNKDRQAQIFSMAYQGARRQKELDEEKRQFDIMLPLNQKLKEQELAINSINITNALRNQEEKIESEKSYSKVAQLWTDHLLAGIAGTESSEARIWQTIANNPKFYLHDKSKDFLTEMKAARMSREKERESEREATVKLGVELEQTKREELRIAGRADVADTRSQTDIQEAQIRARAKVDAALISAEKWKDHSRFAAFKEKTKMLALREQDPVKYSEAVKNLYEALLPSGEPNAWDATGQAPATAAPVAPVPSIGTDGKTPATAIPVKSRDEMNAVPSGSWYINPADGKRYRKK